MQLFGSSGIRTLANKDLFSLAFKVGMAVGRDYGRVVVGTDSRTTGDVLRHAVIAGVLATGATCADAGLLPTPTLAFVTRHFDACVMITASHNPPEYNGMKLLNPDGSAFDAAQQKRIEKMIADDSLAAAPWNQIKSSGVYLGAVDEHIERILEDFPASIKLKVVVDSGCGAASLVTPHLLRRLGCEVMTLDCYPSGFFPRVIEPVESNLGNLMKATRDFGADLGIAHDGDADRMMAVDDKGRFIPGDKLLVVLARSAGAQAVVTTVDASMAVEERGFAVRRTKVGDTFVSDELKHGGEFGGEPSGAWVFPTVSLCPDGIYAAARLVDIAARQKLSAMVDAIPSYPILRGSISTDGLRASEMESRLMALGPASVSKIDGLRLDFGDGWLLVRPSGTEPKIRLTAEAKTEARARQLHDSGVKALKGL